MKENTMKLKDLQINVLNLEQLMKERKFIIPSFLPIYDWEKQQVDDLFRDLLMSYKQQNDYFLGDLFSTNFNPNVFHLFEGTNRLTTILEILQGLSTIEQTNKETKTLIQTICLDEQDSRIMVEKESGGTRPPVVPTSLKHHIGDVIHNLFKNTPSAEEIQHLVTFIIQNIFFIFKNIDSVAHNTHKNKQLAQVLKTYRQINIRGKSFNSKEIDVAIQELEKI
jgi:hypothetical protein